MNTPGSQDLPAAIENVEQLERLLSEPSAAVIETFSRVDGDVLLLGVGGKMGPTLARMAKRASDAAGKPRRVIGVARFSTAGLEAQLHAHGVETIRCDLLEEAQVEQLPEAPNVVFMAGMKFGATGNLGLTWAMNSYLPAVISRKFRRSKIVAFSTGNVYGPAPVASGGSRESDPPNPVGEYAMSCLGRERMFEHFSRALSIPMALIRLNYACELRYGVLVDLARRVWTGEAIDLGTAHFNIIWQGDANAMTLLALERVAIPPWVINVTGPELLSVREVAEEFGRLMGKPVRFRGEESTTALLSNAQTAFKIFGLPRVRAAQVLRWIAAWVMAGGQDLGKPTHFDSRDGKF